MPLIDQVKASCDRLASLGWRDLLLAVSAGQLDISAPNSAQLGDRLTMDLDLKKFMLTQPGFEDFATNGQQAVQAGQPVYNTNSNQKLLVGMLIEITKGYGSCHR